MMFLRKPSSVRLLVEAEKAEAVADAALAVVSKARAKAIRQRFLAARVEAEETADRLEKEALATELLAYKALHDHSFALHERDVAEGAFLAAQKNVDQVRQLLHMCEEESQAAAGAAKAARKKVPKTEGTE